MPMTEDEFRAGVANASGGLNTRDGLTVGDPLTLTSEVAFEVERIREQTQASHTVRGEKRDVGVDDFKSAIMGAGEETKWKNGIEVGDPQANAERRAAEEHNLAEGYRLLNAEESERAELEGYRRRDVVEIATHKILYAESGADEALGWSMLRPDERVQLVETGIVARVEAAMLDQAAADFTSTLRVGKEIADAQDAAVREEARRVAVYARMTRERGLSGQAAERWWEETAGHAAAQGVDVSRLSAADFEAHLLASETHMQEDRRAAAVQRMKVDLLNTPDGNVWSGLTKLDDRGFEIPASVPRAGIEHRPNYERALERRIGGYGAGDPRNDDSGAIRAAVAYDDPKTREYDKIRSDAKAAFARATANR